MKAVLISIQPKWCELIASGKKTVEVRKTKPKRETPFKVYIYCTKGKHEALWRYGCSYYYDTQFPNERPNKANGKVIGEFICDELTGGFWISPFTDYLQRQSCLSYDEVCDYANGKPIFAWHISNLVIYDKPKELSEFRSYNVRAYLDNGYPMPTHEITRPPQSWCYVEKGGI